VESVEPLLDDLETVDEDLREKEGKNADGEHRQGDASTLGDELDTPERQPEVDGEAREGPKQDCFAERQVGGSITNELGRPNPC
jgi:hypothetical protein